MKLLGRGQISLLWLFSILVPNSIALRYEAYMVQTHNECSREDMQAATIWCSLTSFMQWPCVSQ